MICVLYVYPAHNKLPVIKVHCIVAPCPTAHVYLKKKYDPISFVPLLIKTFTGLNFLAFLFFWLSLVSFRALLFSLERAIRVPSDKIVSLSEGSVSEVLRQAAATAHLGL